MFASLSGISEKKRRSGGQDYADLFSVVRVPRPGHIGIIRTSA